MAQTNFEKTTEWLLVHEGGYVNHPKDPGGATNRGVTQRTYNGYRRRMGQKSQSVKRITEEEVYAIYRTQYWDAVWGDALPAGLDYAVYDFAVNSGPGRALKFLQKILGVPADGGMGNITMGAVRAACAEPGGTEDLITELCNDRWAWMKRLRTFKMFGRGWTRRVMGNVAGAQPGEDHGVIDRAIKLAHGAAPTHISAPSEALPGKAEEADLSTAAATADGALDPKNALKVGAGAVPGLVTAAAAVPEGPVQYAVGAVLVILAVAGAVIAYKLLTGQKAAA